MTVDFDRYPLLDAYDRQILANGNEVLFFIAAGGTVTVHFPIEYGDTSIVGLAPDHRDQFMAAAREAGAIVVDCRPCDYDDFLLTALSAPLPAIGPLKRLRIDGSRDPHSWITASDYARIFADIGAVTANLSTAGERNDRGQAA